MLVDKVVATNGGVPLEGIRSRLAGLVASRVVRRIVWGSSAKRSRVLATLLETLSLERLFQLLLLLYLIGGKPAALEVVLGGCAGGGGVGRLDLRLLVASLDVEALIRELR